MGYDGVYMAAVLNELEQRLSGGRLQRVYHPGRRRLELRFVRRGEHRLLVSVEPGHLRLHLTEQSLPNPPEPSAFCMLLRKHLEGARLTSLSQEDLERVTSLRFETTDELGRPHRPSLMVELTGRDANIILVDSQGTIIDALRRVGPGKSPRPVIPGFNYEKPPGQDKVSLLALSEPGVFDAFLDGLAGAERQAWRAILDRCLGPGPVLSRELCRRAGIDPARTASSLDPEERFALGRTVLALAADVRAGRYQPTLLYHRAATQAELSPPARPPRVAAFAAVDLTALPGQIKEHDNSPSRLLDRAFSLLETEAVEANLRARAERAVAAAVERVERRRNLQQAEVDEAGKAEYYRRCAELIMASLDRIEPRSSEAVVPDWYRDDGAEVRIPLNPALRPAENAESYYRRYSRAKRGLIRARAELDKTVAELDYLKTVEVSLETAENIEELSAIVEELEAGGYLKQPRPTQKKERPAKDRKESIRSYVSSDGLEILVGKNNRQNDLLVARLARPDDLWLHARGIPGSHVILRFSGKPPESLEEVPETSLEEAARLAATYSKARHSSQVPVDYTFRKNVRKPPGARPGMVFYEGHRTIHVTPDPDLPARLLRRG